MDSKEKSEKDYNIVFENRKRKSDIKLLIKVLVSVVSIVMLAYIISELRINIQYGNVIKEIELNNNKESFLKDYTKLIDNIEGAIVTITEFENNLDRDVSISSVSGVILNREGNIVTSYSKVKEYKDIFVKIPYNEKYIRGTLVGRYEDIDIAIINIEEDIILDYIKIPEDSNYFKNQDIIVVGNISGVEGNEYATTGVINNIHELIDYKEHSYSLIELSAFVNKGNIGGAICNDKGELIGIAIEGMYDNEENINYGISIETIKSIINERDYMDEFLGILDGGIAKDINGNIEGFYVKEINKNTNNKKIQQSDIIKSINSIEILAVEDITFVLKDKENGDILNCLIIRDGKEENINIEIVE